GAGGTAKPTLAVNADTSVMSEILSLLTWAGQAAGPHWTRASVPAGFSTALPKPSQSGSLAGTGQGGRFWEGFGQRGQLSVVSGTPSPSPSGGQVVPPIETPSAMLADIVPLSSTVTSRQK